MKQVLRFYWSTGRLVDWSTNKVHILTETRLRVKHILAILTILLAALFLGGCSLPPLPPEADRPHEPAVVMPPEEHRGRAQIFALENYNQLQLFERWARKRSPHWVFDRKGIRFEEDKGEVTLALTGRYFGKFDSKKAGPQEEGEELWRKVVGPFTEEIFVKKRVLLEEIYFETNFKLGFERMTVEVRFERENFALKNTTQDGRGHFIVKIAGLESGPRPQNALNFLSRTEVLIDGKPVALRANILGEEAEY